MHVTKETAIAGVNTEEENMRSEAQLGMESAKDELMQQLESSSQQAPRDAHRDSRARWFESELLW